MRTFAAGISRVPSWLLSLWVIVCGSVFLALISKISLPLFFTPVPLTLQSMGVLVLGAVLGSKRGSLAVLAYLFQGILGFPVFAAGKAGLGLLMGVSGGYYFGFVLAAFLVGYLFEKGNKSIKAFGIGTLVILASGFVWLGVFIGYKNALILGVLPFVLGDFLKMIALCRLFPRS